MEQRRWGEEYSAAVEQQILQLQHGLSQQISSMQIFSTKNTCHRCRTQLSRCLQLLGTRSAQTFPNTCRKVIILTTLPPSITFTSTTLSQFLTHRLVAPKVIVTGRPSRVQSPLPSVLHTGASTWAGMALEQGHFMSYGPKTVASKGTHLLESLDNSFSLLPKGSKEM